MTTENTKKPEKLQPSRTETFILLSITGLYLVLKLPLVQDFWMLWVQQRTSMISNRSKNLEEWLLVSQLWYCCGHSLCSSHSKVACKATPRLFSKGLFALLRTAGISLFVSYQLQQGILNYIEDRSTAEQRQAATSLTLMSGSVQDELATLKGLDFDVVGISQKPKRFLRCSQRLLFRLTTLIRKQKKPFLIC